MSETRNRHLEFLYSDQAQQIVAKHFYRPWKPSVAAPEDIGRFKVIPMITVDEEFGGWMAAHAAHFGKGGTFERVLKRATEGQGK